jgi:tetratricopeptide (TPR) repeat protein
MSELDVIGALTGTDKSSSVSWAWDYLRHYEELFSRWRTAEVNMIEIGVASGSSLAAWLWYFDKAQIVGIDVNPECRRYAQDRVAIRIGSQEDPGFLHSVAAEFPPTIVIDDGSHQAHHMIASFEALFPALRPGGIYVFEDLAFHFDESARRFQDAKAHQGLAEMPIFDYLYKYIRGRAASTSIPDGCWGFSRYAFEHIDTISVMGGMLAVRKKAQPDIDFAVSVFERELNGAHFSRHEAALRFSEFLIIHDTQPERALSLLSEVAEAEPGNELALKLLSRLLIRFHRFDEASGIAARLTQIDRNNLGYWEQSADVESWRGRFDLESAALQRLLEAHPRSARHYHRLSVALERLGDAAAAAVAAGKASELEPGNPDYRKRQSALQ